MKKKILFIVGSLRKGSFNRQLAELAADLIKEKAEACFLEYGDIPYMDQDKESPVLEEIARVRQEALESDGIWIFTPEYNHFFPGVLKNLLDWLSRPLEPGNYGSGTAVAGKPVTISGAGGKMAASGARESLTSLLGFMRMKIMDGHQTGVALPGEAFMGKGYTPTEETVDQLKVQADEFLKFIDQA